MFEDQNVIDQLLQAVQFECDEIGNPVYVYQRPAKILSPDREKTRRSLQAILDTQLGALPREDVYQVIVSLVSDLADIYSLTHDGFRRARNHFNLPALSVNDVYTLSYAAGEVLDLLSDTAQNFGPRIGIGVMAPAVQDSGKNLIRQRK